MILRSRFKGSLIHRELSEKLVSLSKSFPVISLTGPRQSGKTTLVRKTFDDYRYVNLENPDQRLNAEEDPRRFLRSLGEKAIIDEAQRAPELFSYIQGIVDESHLTGQFILTGSQNFLLLESISQSLAGRVAILNLQPFSISELQKTDFPSPNPRPQKSRNSLASFEIKD